MTFKVKEYKVWELYDLLVHCLERVALCIEEDKPTTWEEMDDIIRDCVDNEIMWYDNQWELLQMFFNPSELTEYSLYEAIEHFTDDIYNCIEEAE